MYRRFYNLTRSPFHITPDPAFLFLSTGHKEALGAIIYCVENRKGFVSVIGEVGCGKTTIVRSYLKRIDKKRVRPIYVFNASVSFAELLKTIFQELGLPTKGGNIADMVRQLHVELIKEYNEGRNIVLIIDEAQNMPIPTLEQLRILSNLETTKDKLLQIVLIGQPELETKLNFSALRQLKQRLAVRATLHPLSRQESHAYIRHRLALSGAAAKEIFAASALNRIVDYSKGTPRLLNILCDNALIAGFGSRKKRISGRMVKQVIKDYEGQPPTRLGRPMQFVLAISLFLVAGAFLLLVSNPRLRALLPQAGRMNRAAISSKAARAVDSAISHLQAVAPWPAATAADSSTAPEQMPAAAGKNQSAGNGNLSVTADSFSPTQHDAPIPLAISVKTPMPESTSPARQERLAPILPPKEVPQQVMPQVTPQATPPGRLVQETWVVKKGENLSKICLEVYGHVNDWLIQQVQESNPQLKNADLIWPGDTIIFPALSQPLPRQANHGG